MLTRIPGGLSHCRSAVCRTWGASSRHASSPGRFTINTELIRSLSPTALRLLFLSAILAALAIPEGLSAQENPADLYEQGMEAFRTGRCETAIEKLESAVSLDPSYLDARIPLAECYYSIGVNIGAIQHLKVYLMEAPDGAEKDRAQALLERYQRELAEMAGVTTSDTNTSTAAGGVAPQPAGDNRSFVAMVDLTVGIAHVTSSYQPTFGEIDVGLRAYVARYLGLGLAAGVGLGGGPGVEGLLRFPEFRVSAGFVPPLKNVKLLLGAELLLVGTKLEGNVGFDPGALFVAEVRSRIKETPLFVGGSVSAGYFISFYVGGRAVVGIEIGRKRSTE